MTTFHKAEEMKARLQQGCEGQVSVLDAEKASLSPDAALARLREGNMRYQKGASTLRDHREGRSDRAAGQAPFAALVSCADSRVAPELAFDQAPGDLFVCRLAGNVINADVLASLEYAVAFLGTSLIIVMGHSGCGAVDAAVKVADTGTVLPGHLDQLASAILPAVQRVSHSHAEAAREARLDACIAENARLNAERIGSRSAALAEAVAEGRLKIVAAVYDIGTGAVKIDQSIT